MDKRKSKTYRDKLLARREGLVGQVQAAEAYSRERDAEATQDPADLAANAYTKELLVSMSANDRQLLESIDAALDRIENGKYGKCIHCGQPIQEKEQVRFMRVEPLVNDGIGEPETIQLTRAHASLL